MKIDTDLRLAIKSAERMQPQDSWEQRAKREQESIATWAKKFPAKAKVALALRDKARKASIIKDAAEEELCKTFGLRRCNETDNPTKHFVFSHCGGNADRFEKAGGKIHITSKRWKTDEVMARIAAATPQEGAKIIASLGINWK